MLDLFKRHPIASIGFLLALAVSVFFAFGMVFDTRHWKDPANRNQTPEAWMTPRYIAHSWGMDPMEVAAAVGLTQRPKERPTLERIARNRGVPVEVVIEEVKAFLASRAQDPEHDPKKAPRK
jgi:hypothetical protein